MVSWVCAGLKCRRGATSRPRDRVRLGTGQVGDRDKAMPEPFMPTILGDDRRTLRAIAKIDDEVDIAHGSISQSALTEEQAHYFINLMAAATELENSGDVI